MGKIELTVFIPHNCGNSPQIKLIKELNIYMAKLEFRFFYDYLTDNVQWNILGLRKLIGKDKVIEVMEEIQFDNVLELNLHSIISHGTAGAVNGVVTMENQKQYAYCSIYTFTSNSDDGKIKEMTTYFYEVND